MCVDQTYSKKTENSRPGRTRKKPFRSEKPFGSEMAFRLENDTFYAKVVLKANDETIQLDARPSDAIALAVRAKVPIFVEESVLDKAGVILDKESSEQSSLQVDQEDFMTQLLLQLDLL